MTGMNPDPPPPWLHAEIMAALAPHLQRLREQAETEQARPTPEPDPIEQQ